MNPLFFKINNKSELIITGNVVEKFYKYRQLKKGQNEAGGLLIGRHLAMNDNILVDQLTEPSVWDNRFYAYFYRSNTHNKKLKNIWKKSNKTQTLIGLWHTHPQPVPEPSSVDYKDWRKTIKHGDFVGDFLFFLIIGINKIRVWQGNRSTHFFELIEINKQY